LYLSITNLWMLFLPSGGGINFSENGGCKITDYSSLFALLSETGEKACAARLIPRFGKPAAGGWGAI